MSEENEIGLRNKEKAVLAAIVLLFCFLQIFFILNESVTNDEMVYAWQVLRLNQDPSFLFSQEMWQFHPPLFSLLAFPLSAAVDPLVATRLVSILFGAGAILLVFRLGRKISNPSTGLMAAALTSFFPYFFITAHYGLLDSGMVFATLLVVDGLLAYPEKGFLGPLVIGTLTAIFLKRSGFIVYGLLAIGILLAFFTRKSDTKQGKHFLFVSFTWLALVGLLAWFFSTLFDRPILTFYDYSAGPLSYLLHNAPLLANIIPLFLTPFAFLGLISFIRTKRQKGGFVMGAWVLAFLPILFFPYADTRYFLPLLPLAMIFVAQGVEAIRFQSMKITTLAHVFLIMVLVAPLAVQSVVSLSNQSHNIGFSDAGKWLSENAKGSVIYDALEREIRYYSGFELAEWGGPIVKYPPTPEVFHAQVARDEKNAPSFAVVGWPNIFGPYYPSDSFLEKEGFVKVYGVVRPQGGKPTEVIRIYKKSIADK